MLTNKLAIATHKINKQYTLIRASNFQTKSLIKVLYLQVVTQSKIRLTADNLMFIKNANLTLLKSMSFSSLTIDKKKTSILNLIKDIQELNLQCRQIDS